MMWEVLKFECRTQLRSPLFLVLAIVFALFAFFLTSSEDIQLGGLGNNININAWWGIVYTQFFFSLIGMFAAVAIVSQAITRDYELQTAELLFTTGVSPIAFVLGRFLGALLFASLVGAAALFGTLLGTLMPWLDQERVGAFSLTPYVYALLVVTLPNFFFTGAFFYALAALTRSMLAAFIGSIGFLVAYIIVGSIVDREQAVLYAMLDPFGSGAFSEVSRYWTVFERNNQLVPLEGNLLWNRILWVGVGVIAMALTLWRYRFDLSPSPFGRRVKKQGVDTVPALQPLVPALRFGAGQHFAQLRSQVRMDLRAILKSLPFYALMGFATLNVVGGFYFSSGGAGTPLLPTTAAMLRVIEGSYLFFILMVVLYFAGEVVHRERQTRVSEVLDATPYPNFVMVLSKVITLWFIVICLLMFGMVSAIVVQLLQDFFNVEVLLYLGALLFVFGGFFFLLAVLAVFIQVLLGNKWMGMLGLLVVFIGFQSASSLGFEHSLYNFGTPSAPYSDMNGYGHYLEPLIMFTLYWSAFCVLLAIAAHLFYPRGLVTGWAQRWADVRQRLSSGLVTAGVSAAVVFLAVGGWIFYNTNVVNEYKIQDEVEAQQARYEKTYKSFETLVQPEVEDVVVDVDLYPAERLMRTSGTLLLANHHTDTIEELFVSTHPFARLDSLDLYDDPSVEVIAEDLSVGVRRFRLHDPLLPGDKMRVAWSLTWDHNGFPNPNPASTGGNTNTRVVANGTFVNNTEVMPFLGYNFGLELGDPNKRREYDLPPIVRQPKIDDERWHGVNQLGVAARTNFRTRFSTSADQIAIAPGYLVGDVEEENDRRTFTYAMDAPIWPFFAFVSARYEVLRDKWNDVDIEIYHDPKHAYNVDSMVNSTKKSLDYFSSQFSPYQYRQFRILEFPRYQSFAQAFPNTIPYSEAIGFVADLRDEDDINLVFYVTAHEMAHQWWAHQAIGARTQGATAIIETLAQYSALMVMKAEYGEHRMRQFLRRELDSYLVSRGGELIEELPLVLNENQGYIHYRKGSLVMYALQDLIGEQQVNLALRNFLAKYAFKGAPFPTALDMVAEFRSVADAQYQDVITDLFEKITLFDLRVEEASVARVGEQYEVRITTGAAKFYADGEGQETPAAMDAWVDIAVFPDTDEEMGEFQLPEPLYFEKVRLDGEAVEMVILVDEAPARVGIDPYNKLIDRNPEDNLKRL
ncbi:MAG: M1 family aminopeptidase, partial [Pseudomonadota bacterium]